MGFAEHFGPIVFCLCRAKTYFFYIERESENCYVFIGFSLDGSGFFSVILERKANSTQNVSHSKPQQLSKLSILMITSFVGDNLHTVLYQSQMSLT